jgi:hypothetical protein
MCRTNGYSLAEMMLSIVIGLILVTICVLHLLQVSQIFGRFLIKVEKKNALALARYYIGEDLMNAGFLTAEPDGLAVQWCDGSLHTCAGLVPIDVLRMILAGDIKEGSGILVLRRVPVSLRLLAVDMVTVADRLQIHEPMVLQQGDHCEINDFSAHESFLIRNFKDNVIEPQKTDSFASDLEHLYKKGAVVFCPRTVVYYVKNNILYRDDIVRNAISILNGINKLHVNNYGQEIEVKVHFVDGSIYSKPFNLGQAQAASSKRSV